MTKSIVGASGWTCFAGIPLLPFRLDGTRLLYRGLPLVDQLEPLVDGSWDGRGYVFGLPYCRFRLVRD